MVDLSGAFAKLARAKHHTDEFNAQGFEWLTATVPKDKPGIVQRFEPSDHDPAEGVVIYSIADLQLPLAPIELSLVFGDALTNYRAVLDYIAWQAAVSPSDPKQVWFPILDDHAKFPTAIKGRIPGIDPTHRAIIERYQPYKWGSQKTTHPLAMLNRLVTHDKHRALRLMAVAGTQVKVNVPESFPNFRVTHREGKLSPFEFEPGTDILRIYGRKIDPTRDPEVKVYWHDGHYGVRLVDEPRQAEVVLTQVARMVGDLLREFDAIT